jgi:hypothetical protein
MYRSRATVALFVSTSVSVAVPDEIAIIGYGDGKVGWNASELGALGARKVVADR